MRLQLFPTIIMVSLMAVACTAVNKKETRSSNNDAPRPSPSISLATPEGFTTALAQRWSKESIVRFCSPGRRWKSGCQNLLTVPHGGLGIWEQDLYKGSDTGFDRIWWYATEYDNKIQTYSLNASRGEDHWVIEVGDVARLNTEPEIEPASKAPCFEDGNHPGDK